MRFDHIGIVVYDIVEGRRQLHPIFDIERWTEVFEERGRCLRPPIPIPSSSANAGIRMSERRNTSMLAAKSYLNTFLSLRVIRLHCAHEANAAHSLVPRSPKEGVA